MRLAKLMIAALALSAGAATAKDKYVFVEGKAVPDKPAVAFDPAKAYILVRSESMMPLMLMKDPTQADLDQYAKLRAEAFAEVRESYERKLARWKLEADQAAARKLRKPEKPVEPTEANFELTPINLLTRIDIGPQNRFAKAGRSTYLHAVTPGSYRVYGQLMFIPNNGFQGTCFCMGSVRFEAKAGEIVDLGTLEPMPPADGANPAKMERFVRPGGEIDPRLKDFPIRPAVFRPAGKLPNYFGVTISRVPAIDGVMRYDRDRIVDLTVGN